MAGDGDDDWCIEDPNEEWYNPTKLSKGTWMPEGKVILELLERIQKEKILELKWKCPGRRPPVTEQPQEAMETEADFDEAEIEEEKAEDKSALFGEFDFDDAPSEMSTKITPRRTPGSGKSQRPQKRVACMDNVLNKIRTQRKQNEAARASRGLGMRGRRTPIYSSGTPKARTGSSHFHSSGATPSRSTSFDFVSSKPSTPAFRSVPMEMDSNTPNQPAAPPARSEVPTPSSATSTTASMMAQSKVPQLVTTSGPASTVQPVFSSMSVTTPKANTSSSTQQTSQKETTEYREPIPKLLLKIPPPSTNQPMTSTLLPPGYSRAAPGGQGSKKSPTGKSGTQKTPSSNKPKTPPLYPGGPKTSPLNQNPPRTPPASGSGNRTPPAANPGVRTSPSSSMSPKGFSGQPRTPPAFSSGSGTPPGGYMSKVNPLLQQQFAQSQANLPTSHPPPSYSIPQSTTGGPHISQQSQTPAQRMSQMSQIFPRMPQMSQYSPRKTQMPPSSSRNPPVSPNQPRTFSQAPPRASPVSPNPARAPVPQNQPRTPFVSQTHPRPSLTLTIPKNPPVAPAQPRTPPASQNPPRSPLMSHNQPRTPPISQNQQRTPLFSLNPPRTPPVSQAQPRTPPAAQNQPRTPPISQNPSRTPPFSQNQPRTPPFAPNQPRMSPVSQNPPRTPPSSHVQQGPHHPHTTHPLYQFPHRPLGQQHPPRPRQMSPPNRMPSVTSPVHTNHPRAPFQGGVHPAQFPQSRPKTPPAYHTVVSRSGPFPQSAQPVPSMVSTASANSEMTSTNPVSLGGQLGVGNPAVNRTSPSSPRQLPVPLAANPQAVPSATATGMPSPRPQGANVQLGQVSGQHVPNPHSQ